MSSKSDKTEKSEKTERPEKAEKPEKVEKPEKAEKADKGDAAAIPVTFASLSLFPSLVSAVTALGYEEPTPIQREAIPVLCSGRDLVGLAGTGTGKTAAFALPMLNRLLNTKKPASSNRFPPIRGMVLVPTRELAMQVAEAIHKYARGSQLNVVPCYGGAPMDQQIRALQRGASVVVATPGRAIDHLNRKTLDVSELEVLILDEADEMLDMGFAEDLETIITATPESRQTALFAATMAPRIAKIADAHLNKPARVTIAREKRSAGKLPRIRQVAYIVPRSQKVEAFSRVLEFEDPKSAIVFCRTRIEVDQLTDTLKSHGYGAQAIHGGMEQKQRDRVMNLFRSGKLDMLVATDVAARGIDIDHVSHVVNFDVPNAPEVYVHRIGRTGRAGREGTAITFADHRERRFLRNIENLTKQPIEIANLPTASDLRVKRLEIARTSLQEKIDAGGLVEEKTFLQSLTQTFDITDIAAAAIAIAFSKGDSTAEIKDLAAPKSKVPTVDESDVDLSQIAIMKINLGKKAGVRAGDLVGAIAGEAGISSKMIGGIRIDFMHSLVEIPEQLFDRVIAALTTSTIRGKKVDAERWDGREERAPRPDRGDRPARTNTAGDRDYPRKERPKR